MFVAPLCRPWPPVGCHGALAALERAAHAPGFWLEVLARGPHENGEGDEHPDNNGTGGKSTLESMTTSSESKVMDLLSQQPPGVVPNRLQLKLWPLILHDYGVRVRLVVTGT